jgi:hypothetical protein
LKHIGTLLETAPPGRKIVMLISTQGTMGVNTDPVEQVNPVQEMFRALQQANVTVFAFDPRGLSLRGRPDDLMSLTDATGGRTIANTNAPEAHVPDVFRQNSAYYLLGFRSDDSRRNGRFRKVEVKVTRTDVQVRTRSGYFAPRDEKPKRSRATPLVRTLEHGIPGRDLPIRLNVAMFGIPGRREAAVTLVASVTDRASASTSRRLEMLATAFDTGWKERATHRQTIDFRTVQADVTDLEFDVLSRLSLRPGRYEVRLAAESDGRVGSVLLNIDVPDFYKDDLSLSGVLLERTSTPVVGNERLLADLVPVTPTAIREFQRGDTVSVFARVYQGGKGSLLPATVTSKIVNASDEIVFERTAEFDAVEFGARRGADYKANLPLSDLRAGHYLLTIEAAAGQGRARRDVRFEVR